MKLRIGGKCSDMGHFYVVDDGKFLIDHDGYMPHIKSICGGDYIDFAIDNETGKIIGWVPLTDENIKNIKEELDIEDESNES